MSSIFLVGGSGTLGRRFCQEISRLNSPFRFTVYCRKPQLPLKDIHYITGDLDDHRIIAQIIECNPRQILFMASAFHPRASKGKVFEVINTFILPSLRLISAILKHCRPKEFIFLSSYYGINDSLYFSNDLCTHTPYSMEKLILESSLYTMCSEVGCKLALLRLANIFSPEENKTDFGVINVFSRLIANNMEDQIKIINGDIAKDYIHVDDFLSLLIKILSIPLASNLSVYNVGSGYAVTPIQILLAIKEIHSRQDSVPSIPCTISSFDISLLRDTYSWTPKYTIYDMIYEAYTRYVFHNKPLR